ETLWVGDFSKLNKNGTFYAYVRGESPSPSFKISENPLKGMLKAALRTFYYQRCGDLVRPRYSGRWHHGKCHLKDSFSGTDGNLKMDLSGGWHNGTGYGKFLSPTAYSIAVLMDAYSSYAENIKSINLGFRESRNTIPDCIDIIQRGLNWTLKCQVPCGAVISGIDGFERGKQPHQCKAGRIAKTGKGGIYSTVTTAVFAALHAKATIFFKNSDPEFAKKNLDAAQRAWDYLQKQEKTVPSDAGEFSDFHDLDESLWATAELYAATKKRKYETAFEKIFLSVSFDDFLSVKSTDTRQMAMRTYLKYGENNNLKKKYLKIYQCFIDNTLEKSSKNAYGISLSADEYKETNARLLEYAIEMSYAKKYFKNTKYMQIAENNMNYILGQNPFSLCFVSGFGKISVKHFRNNWFNSDGINAVPPGYIPFGADTLNASQLSNKPACCYSNTAECGRPSEISLSNQARLVYLILSLLESSEIEEK
ncbi:MAG: glycoside hydrolase family 9 protein, partial [Verrucomicrobiota bacterium]|nr:glycoside hydrolase family 9 protein [Verrucomicrobiota bacterium]